jgi:hypothetical protein
MAEQAGTLSCERNLSLKLVVALSKSALITLPAHVHRIHCLLSFLQAHLVCGSHPVCQRMLKIIVVLNFCK